MYDFSATSPAKGRCVIDFPAKSFGKERCVIEIYDV